MLWQSLPFLLGCLVVSFIEVGEGTAVPVAGGAALSFDGVNDFAVIFPSFDFTSNWTLELWVKPTSASLQRHQCLLQLSTFWASNLLSIEATNQYWQVRYGLLDTISMQDVSAARLSGANQHLAITHNIAGPTVEVYINGARARSVSVTDANSLSSEPPGDFLLGMCSQQTSYGFARSYPLDGTVDELRYWSVVRTGAEIAAARSYSGSQSGWPAAGDGPGLEGQYTFDTMSSPRLIDVSTANNNDGLLGGGGGSPIDQPQYVASPFTGILNSLQYVAVRAMDTAATVSCPSDRCIDVSGIFTPEGGITFQGYRVNQLPSTPGVRLMEVRSNGFSRFVSVGMVLTTNTLFIRSDVQGAEDTFSLQKCINSGGNCGGRPIVTYTVKVLSSTRPLAGQAYSLQLLGSDAYLELPEPFAESTSVEAWVQMDHLHGDQAVLSVTRRSDGLPFVSLGYFGGSFQFYMCKSVAPSLSEANPTTVLLPELETTQPQHIALTMDFLATSGDTGADYRIGIYRNCQLVSSFYVNGSCMVLNDTSLTLPTFGQQYELSGGWLSPTSFASMNLADIRIWSTALTQTEICDRYNKVPSSVLDGVLDLQAHFPVTRTDYELPDPFLVASSYSYQDDLRAYLRCSVARIACPSAGEERGFIIRPSVFSELLPFETQSYEAVGGTTLSLPMSTFDQDNWPRGALASTMLDSATIGIVQGITAGCGTLRTQGGSQLGAGDTASGSQLPVQYVPSQSQTCTTDLVYTATDSQGLAAPSSTGVSIATKAEAPQFVSVEAFDPEVDDSGLDIGDIIALTFDQATNGRLDWQYFIEVLDGTFGTARINAYWNNASTVLQLEILEPLDLDITPGTTRFRVRGEVAYPLRRQGEDSYPSMGTLVLTGDFGTEKCSDGHVYSSFDGACSSCGPGNYEVVAKSRCAPCRPGTFSAADAVAACTPCPVGRYLPPGSTVRTSCRIATPGHYVGVTSSPYLRPCPSGMVAEHFESPNCTLCPHGADCISSSGVFAEPKPGFYRNPDNTIVRCPAGHGACLGWNLATMENVCAQGMAGVWCQGCVGDWTRPYDRPRSKCLECGWDTLSRIVVVLLFESIGAWIVAAWAVNAAVWGHSQMVYLRLLLNYFTLVSVLGGIEKWELEAALGSEFADAASSTLHVAFRFDGGIVAQLMSLECVFGRDGASDWDVLKNQFLFWFFLPLLWPLAMGVLAFIFGELSFLFHSVGKSKHSMPRKTDRSLGLFRRLAHKQALVKRWSMQAVDCIPVMLVGWMLALPTALRVMAVMLACGRLEDTRDEFLLLAAPQITCWEGDHSGWATFAILGIFGWGIVVPLILGLFLWVKRHSFRTSQFVKVLFGYAGDGFKYRYVFWDMVVQLRRLLVILVAVWPDLKRPEQLALYQVIGVAAVILHLELDPFDVRTGRVLDEMELLGLAVFLLVVTVMQVVIVADPASKYNLVPLFFAMTLTFASLTIMVALLHFYRGHVSQTIFQFGTVFILTLVSALATCIVLFQDASPNNEYEFRQFMGFMLIMFVVACNILFILWMVIEILGEMRRALSDAFSRRKDRRLRQVQREQQAMGMQVAWSIKPAEPKGWFKRLIHKVQAFMHKSEHANQAYVHYDTTNNELWLGLHPTYMHDKGLTAHTRRKLAEMAPFLTIEEREDLCAGIYNTLLHIFVELDYDDFPCIALEVLLRAPFVFKYMRSAPLEEFGWESRAGGAAGAGAAAVAPAAPAAPSAAARGAPQPSAPGQAPPLPGAVAGAEDAPAPQPGVAQPASGGAEGGADVVPGQAVRQPEVAIGYPADDDGDGHNQTYRERRRQAFFMDPVLGANMTVADFMKELHDLTTISKEDFETLLQEYMEDRTTQQLVQGGSLL